MCGHKAESGGFTDGTVGCVCWAQVGNLHSGSTSAT